jgi:hypothetical protein
MKRVTQATEWTCDGCGSIEITTDDEPPLGLTGTVIETTKTYGGYGGEWFACKRSCVPKAIVTVIEREPAF